MNAQRRGEREVVFSSNSILLEVMSLLHRKKYILDFTKSDVVNKNMLLVKLRYDEFGEGVIKELKRYSKSSRRVYSASAKIPRVKNGFATVIVSTSKGVMTGLEARQQKVGGEIICHVY